MASIRRFNVSLLLAVLVLGILAGHSLTRRSMNVDQASAREQELASLQAAQGAINMMKFDMERAGYAETVPPSTAVAVRLEHDEDAQPPLMLATAFGQLLAFRSPDSGHRVSYETQGRQLVRVENHERLVLMEDARNFKVRTVAEGKVINVAFDVPVGTQQSAVYGHFVKAAE